MGQASIPVDLRNPGQVFASVGFLEMAHLLDGAAESRFDWSDRWAERYFLRTSGEGNPFETVLRALTMSEVHELHPREEGDVFPTRSPDTLLSPVRLQDVAHRWHVTLCHWSDASGPKAIKNFSGTRSAASILHAMLEGTADKRGLKTLWAEKKDKLIASPFHVLTGMGGSFGFDPRGAWTALGAGYSLNDHATHRVASSPVVEFLAAVGIEHARPFLEDRRVAYAAWGEWLPPLLARPVLGGGHVGVPIKKFHLKLAISGKNKVFTFAQEDGSP